MINLGGSFLPKLYKNEWLSPTWNQESVKIDFQNKFPYVANIGKKLVLLRYCEIPGMLVICMSKLSWFNHSKY